MAKKGMSKTKIRKVGGLTIDQWNDKWEPSSGGFLNIDQSLHGVSGVWRALYEGDVVAIGSSWATDNAALYGRLKIIMSENIQTGNAHHQALKIRANPAALQLEIIRLGKGYGHQNETKKLSLEMRRFFQPAWNAKNPKLDKPV